jgi:hypothetical protein
MTAKVEGRGRTGVGRTEAGVAAAQGAYYVLTGLWPIFHLRSFELVTGPKPEGWLVKMVGALAACIGGALIGAARSGRFTPELRGLALGAAASFAAVDVWYVARRRIAPIYLLDALPEVAALGYWATRAREPAAQAASAPAGA